MGTSRRGTKAGPGRPPGSPNKIPKSIKQVVRDLCEGVIEVTYKDPATEKLVEGPVAHLLAERMVAGLKDPQNYPAFVKMFLEYGIGRPKTQSESGADDRKQIPRMIFLSQPYDPMAKPGDPPKPLRILGQTAGPNGEIIDAKTRKVVVAAPARSGSGPVDDGPVDDGLGELSHFSSRRVMNACASWIDIGSGGDVLGSTPCRASEPSTVGLFTVRRKRVI